MDPSDAFKAARLMWSTGTVPLVGQASSSINEQAASTSAQGSTATGALQPHQQAHQASTSAAVQQATQASASVAVQEASQASASANVQQAPQAPTSAIGLQAPPQNAPQQAGALTTLNATLERIATALESIAANYAAVPAAPSAAPAQLAVPVPLEVLPAPLSGAAQAGEEYDPYVPIDDSEDDVDPSTRCGVCKAGLCDVQYALECGHHPYCNECVQNLQGFLNSKYECPFCKATGKNPLLLKF